MQPCNTDSGDEHPNFPILFSSSSSESKFRLLNNSFISNHEWHWHIDIFSWHLEAFRSRYCLIQIVSGFGNSRNSGKFREVLAFLFLVLRCLKRCLRPPYFFWLQSWILVVLLFAVQHICFWQFFPYFGRKSRQIARDGLQRWFPP